MHLITRKRIVAFGRKHPRAKPFLSAWQNVVVRARWESIDDVRKSYPHADAVSVASDRTVTVFNVGGGNFRMITAIHYNRQKVFVLMLLTHAEYSTDRWKGQL